MGLLQAVEQLIRLLILTWVDLRRGPILGILALLFALHAAVLVVCADPTFGAWSAVTVPLFRLRFGEFFLHYPQSWIGLPSTGSAARLIVDVLVGPLVSAWWTAAVLAWARRRRAGETELAQKSAAAYLPALALTGLQVAGWIVLYTLPLSRAVEALRGDFRLLQLLTFGGGLVVAAVLTPLFYVLPVVVDRGGGLLPALAESARRVRQAPLLPFLITATPWLVGLPFLYVLRRTATLADRLRPEMVLGVMLAESLVMLVASFFTVESAVRLWLRPRGVGR